MTGRQHLTGFALVISAITTLALIPLVSADVRAHVPLPYKAAREAGQDHHVMLLFAGFPGCTGVCPTTMGQLAATKREVDQRYGAQFLSVAFVNLHFDATDAASTRYATAFHPDFIGFSTPSALGGELKRALGQTGSSNIADLQHHRGNVYLYTRHEQEWQMKKVFSHLPSPAQLAEQLAPYSTASASQVSIQ